MMKVPFNTPPVLGSEINYVQDVLETKALSGNGAYNKKCGDWFNEKLGSVGSVPTPSCTAALEMGLMLAGIQPGDEVILPSYTFTSTATAIVLHGGAPVFVDSDPKTLNINVNLIESAITKKTKAIMPVHYAGVSCDMAVIMALAEKHNLTVIEDAAQCVGAKDEGGYLGRMGHMSAFSFHETKNVSCGEGGMLCVNDAALWDRAEIIRDKGTNRQQFFKGAVDKYSWQDKGSSYLMSEMQAAYLYAQLENYTDITKDRLNSWHYYHGALEGLENQGLLSRPFMPATAQHNAHIYYVLLPSPEKAVDVREKLNERGVNAVIHYVPLHSSSAGEKFGRTGSDMTHVDDFSARLLRLPLFYGMNDVQREYVVEVLKSALS